jgi:hypothetical protein
MSFQAYLDNIKARTGKTPEDFRELAEKAGILKVDMKAAELTDWLQNEFDLGLGHGRAIWNVFVSKGWVSPKKTNIKRR